MASKENKNKKNFTIEEFKNSITRMIATSDDSYNGNLYFRKGISFNTYTKKEVLDTVAEGSSEELKEISLFYLYTSGFYRRFLIYYATLLKYVY